MLYRDLIAIMCIHLLLTIVPPNESPLSINLYKSLAVLYSNRRMIISRRDSRLHGNRSSALCRGEVDVASMTLPDIKPYTSSVAASRAMHLLIVI